MTEKEKDKTGLLVNHRMSVNLWSDVARKKEQAKSAKVYLTDDVEQRGGIGQYYSTELPFKKALTSSDHLHW